MGDLHVQEQHPEGEGGVAEAVVWREGGREGERERGREGERERGREGEREEQRPKKRGRER